VGFCSIFERKAPIDGTGVGRPIADLQTAYVTGYRLDGSGVLEARDDGERLRVVSGAGIHVNVVKACGCLVQAYLT
jgi:hypothetical protein